MGKIFKIDLSDNIQKKYNDLSKLKNKVLESKDEVIPKDALKQIINSIFLENPYDELYKLVGNSSLAIMEIVNKAIKIIYEKIPQTHNPQNYNKYKPYKRK